MLALAGLEPPEITLEEALPIFLNFLALPQDARASDAGFQAELVEEGPGDRLLTIMLGLKYPTPGLSFEPDTPGAPRAVGIQWTHSVAPEDVFAAQDIWVGDYASLSDFEAAIRATPEWMAFEQVMTFECSTFADDA